MRCPYCGGFNKDQAVYCGKCGRDLTQPTQGTAGQYPAAQGYPPNMPPPSYPQPGQKVQGYPPPQQPRQGAQPPYYPPQPPPNTQPRPATPPVTRATVARPQVQAPPVVEVPVAGAPEPPAPFPPHVIAHLFALQQGALQYEVIDEYVNDGRKQVICIVYPRCTQWQQAATLLKAFKEKQNAKYETVFIQGYFSKQHNVDAFNHGQLRFDRNVRLGSLTTNRYQIETDDGFQSDSVRIVLTE